MSMYTPIRTSESNHISELLDQIEPNTLQGDKMQKENRESHYQTIRLSPSSVTTFSVKLQFNI